MTQITIERKESRERGLILIPWKKTGNEFIFKRKLQRIIKVKIKKRRRIKVKKKKEKERE